MAHSAAAAARTRLTSDRSRASSPYDNTFTTATSFKQVIHSTPQREYNETQDEFPLHHNQDQEPSEHGSDGSADMSIELGRGVKRSALRDYDMSSDLVFNFGNDNSQYDVMGTPPVRTRTAQSKPDDTLRKQASVRRATETTRGNEMLRKNNAGSKQRAVSDGIQTRVGQSQQPNGMAAVRGSRFVSSRQVSANYGDIPTRFTANGGLEAGQPSPRQPTQGNATVQSATYNQSFMLPDLPDITELVSGTRKDGTPLAKRGNAGCSRFASATYKPLTQEHATIDGIPLPEDEQAIFISLKHAREKNARLEMEKSEAQKRIEEFELEVAELRNQVQMANRRPDSALGSEDDTLDAGGLQTDKARLQGRVEALQERLSKSERKISVAEITSTRVVKERDNLVTQIAAVYFQNEELSNENQELRDEQTHLSKENQTLRKTIEDLQDENDRLRQTRRGDEQRKSSGTKHRHDTRTQQDANESSRRRSSKKAEEAMQSHEQAIRHRTSEQQDSTFVRDLASRIQREVRKMRKDAASGAPFQPTDLHEQRSVNVRSRSRSKARNKSLHENAEFVKRPISAPAEIDAVESTTLPWGREAIPQEDLTELSVLDPNDVANLRRKLEEEKRSGRLRKRASSIAVAEDEMTARSHSMPRKSSMKDMTGAFDNGTGRFSLHGDDVSRVPKTVRVQSPHSSQDIFEPEQNEQNTATGNFSMLSTASRRRRRTSSNEGMTSAFIIPDITMHGASMSKGDACIQHSAARCTVCMQGEKEVSIPTPVPVSERDIGDVTSATIRPSQPPEEALAMVIKNLEDEIKHLKLQRESQNMLYNQHDPALSKRRRQDVKSKIDVLTEQIEKRCDQVYALYDVVEGQKQQAEAARAKGEQVRGVSEQEIEDTLESIGIDPAQLSGHVSRKAPVGLDSADEMSDDSELPCDGLSDVESEEEVQGLGRP